MEIEHLREFTVIAKLGSFSRAAEELCISQSALSKHILALERELGAPLLIRNARSVSVSPAGEQILPMAAEICALGSRIRVAADKERRKDKALLRIASIPVMAQYDITGALARFQRENPDVTLEVTECEQHDLMDLVRSEGCELAFTRLGAWEEREKDMDYLPFCRDYLVAVMGKEHPLAGKKNVSLSELREENLLFLDQRTGLYALCGRLFSQAGISPRVVYTGHRPENIVELAAEGMGIALLMKGHTDYIRASQVSCVEIAPREESAICLIRKKARKHTPVALAFWRQIREGAIPCENG